MTQTMKPTDTEQQSKEQPEEFFSRWSKRKQQSREEAAVAEKAVPSKTQAEEAPPKLPPVEELTMDSDYSGFFHPKVNEDVRRAALKKLFDDPHFSIIDGMDIYLDDYSISEPIPAAMLKELKQAQNILEWARERKESEAARERQAAGEPELADKSVPELETPATAGSEQVLIPMKSQTEEQETVQQPPPDRPQTA